MTLELDTIVKCIELKLMEAIFARLELALDETWKTLNSRNIQPLVDSISKLDEAHQELAGEAFVEIAAVGRERKQIPIMLKTLSDFGVAMPADIVDWSSPNIAAWSFVHAHEYWGEIKKRTEINSFPRGEWKSFDLEPDTTPSEGVLKRKSNKLERALENHLMSTEFRGRHCRSEVYSVGSVETILFKLTDNKSGDQEVWNEDEKVFKPFEELIAFKIVCTYDYELDRLSVHYPSGNSKSSVRLAWMFADVIFGKNSYKLHEVKYDVERLRFSSKLTAASDLGIKAARIVGFDFLVDNSKKRRRSYYEEDRDIQEVIEAEFKADNDATTLTVNRVYLRITYDSAARQNVERNFIISASSICGLKECPPTMQKNFRNYLKLIGVSENA